MKINQKWLTEKGNSLDFCVLFQTLQNIHSYMEVEGILGCLERTRENVIHQGPGKHAIKKHHSDCSNFPRRRVTGGRQAQRPAHFIWKGHKCERTKVLRCSHQSESRICFPLTRAQTSWSRVEQYPAWAPLIPVVVRNEIMPH